METKFGGRKMIILFLGIFICMIIGGVLCYINTDYENTGFTIAFVGGALSFALIIVLIIGGVEISKDRVIDQKIEMYQEENTAIETNITTAVEKYLEHEHNVYDDLQGENIEVLLVAYPQIKSDTLVATQSEVFINNNNKIKELKEQKLNIQVWRFWVYFG